MVFYMKRHIESIMDSEVFEIGFMLAMFVFCTSFGITGLFLAETITHYIASGMLIAGSITSLTYLICDIHDNMKNEDDR